MDNFTAIVGHSPSLESLIRSAKIVAATDVTVLLKGETGTGKEIFAHAIKNESKRASEPFVALNCAALPESLIESELFGHKKGAFTGATSSTQGLFQAADKGTLFLDEINSLSMGLQAKLLRFLDSGECLAVGDIKPYKVDVRIIAATNGNLMDLIHEGLFRSDLYFRLNVVPLELPKLAERTEDIELLTQHFFKLFAKTHQIKKPTLSKMALKQLKSYAWPGNVRELRNLCERMSVLFAGQMIEPNNLPNEFQKTFKLPVSSQIEMEDDEAEEFNDTETHQTGNSNFILPEVGVELDSLEADLIHQALNRTKGNRSKSAKLLGISRDTLLYRMQKHGFLSS